MCNEGLSEKKEVEIKKFVFLKTCTGTVAKPTLTFIY